MSETTYSLVIQLGGAVFTAGLVWGVLNTKLSWHRRDIDRAQATADGAHERLNIHLENHPS